MLLLLVTALWWRLRLANLFFSEQVRAVCGVIRARAATKVIRNGPVYFRGGGGSTSPPLVQQVRRKRRGQRNNREERRREKCGKKRCGGDRAHVSRLTVARKLRPWPVCTTRSWSVMAGRFGSLAALKRPPRHLRRIGLLLARHRVT